MSALLVDDLVPQVATSANGWHHVRGREYGRLALVPDLEDGVGSAPVVTNRRAGWRLTDRGIKVVVSFFLALFATALVVLVSGFFAVSDAPTSVPQAPAAVAVAG